MSDVHQELAKVEAEVFGEDALRDANGAPMETGHGSNYAKASPAAKSRYHALLDLKTHEDKVAALTQELATANGHLAAKRAKAGLEPTDGAASAES